MKKTGTAIDKRLLREARELTPVLYRLARVLRLRGVQEAGLTPLPPAELEALRYVLDAPGVSVSTLARDLGLHASNVSTMVRGLVARGLIHRDPDPHDRRSVQLQPTINAIHAMARIENAWAEIFADALGSLSDKERAALAEAVPALRALGDSLRARRTRPQS